MDWAVGHAIPAFGIGPLDSLANAVQLVQLFQDEIGTSHIIAQAGKRWKTDETRLFTPRRRTGAG